MSRAKPIPDLASLDGARMDGLVFCAEVYALFENVRSTPEGRNRLRSRASLLEKRLVEELLPICAYIRTNYREGHYLSICWQSGSQSFDASLYRRGAKAEFGLVPHDGFLEVTCAVYPNDYLMRELVGNGGIAAGMAGLRRLQDRSIESRTIVRDGLTYRIEDSQLVISSILKKLTKWPSYPAHTSLIVVCSFGRIILQGDWEAVICLTRQYFSEQELPEIFAYEAITGQTAIV